MTPSRLSRLSLIGQFLRTPTLSRSIVGLMTAAILLLLAVNLTTFFMIQRTAAFNDAVEQSQEVRLIAKDVLTYLVDAETGQRGFLLTGRSDYLQIHDRARRELPAAITALQASTAGDPELEASVEALIRLSRDRLASMNRTLDLARTGRIGEAVQVIRAGQGKALMDAMRTEITALDLIESSRLAERTRLSEQAGFATVVVNAVAGLLILVLAGITLMLIRRYVADLAQAQFALDRVNAGLEEKVRQRTAAMKRANEEIQRFAYIVSHDLRAPLVNVMGFTSELEQAGLIIDRQVSRLETLAPDLVESDAVTAVRHDLPEAIGFIRASTAKMDRLINAILKLSREGRRNVIPETVDMGLLLQSIADSERHQTEAVGAQVVIEDLPSLESDRLSLEQVFSNLVDNAVKYLDSDRPGLITVSGEAADEGWVVFQVADNGRGIAERDHERIFELFRRAGRQDRTGEGVGLAFVRNSVRRLGGAITVESEPGKGSTFTVKFPTRLVLDAAGDSV